jgi:long-chain acyl-CoA synthetase
VIPLAAAKGTEALAVVIPRDENADINVAVQRANESLAEFQRIRHWIAWPKSDFPRTPGTRKVIKGQIAQAVQTMLQPSTSGATDKDLAPLSLPVISRIARVAPAALSPNANLADDLKLDSLGRVELLSALEDQYQIELDEAAITEATTIADIERIVSRGKSEAVAYPYPRWAMRFPFTWIRFVVYHVFFLPLTLIMCRVQTIGVERIAKVKPPVLFISNHVTDVDAALSLSALPWRWRYRMAIAMAGEILREWRMNAKVQYALGAALFNVFPLPRQSGFRQSFEYAGEAVDRGFSILIFPEGTETSDGNLQPFKAGIGLLTSELKVPVVPIMLHGLFEVKKRKQRFVKPGSVSITFGDPIEFSSDQTPSDITRDLELRLRSV